MLLVARDDADILETQLSYHLNAGVDLVLATDHESTDGSAEILESFARDGHVVRLDEAGPPGESSWRRRMAALAANKYGADWIIDSHVDEFWLPRAESIGEVLVAIPSRYGAVQALARVFVPRPEIGGSFDERMTVRDASPFVSAATTRPRLDWALRPIFRARAAGRVGLEREVALDGIVPLRAWYPIEALRFPLRSRDQAQRRVLGRSGAETPMSAIELEAAEAHASGGLASRWPDLVVHDDAVASGLAAGSLVVDERLAACLARLKQSPARGGLGLPIPTVVDDVAYAAECAAVREVDFEPLRLRIAELENRMARLESRLWPRIRRRLARMLRR
jgi:hypothetical protein